MLKLIFWLLLLANAALFALGRGYLGNVHADAHEPARMGRQLNAGQLRLISAEQASAAATPAAAAAPERFACSEVGDFLLADARRFEAKLAALELGDRQSRHNVAGMEISSYIVYIPPQGSKEAADRKAGELRQLGVSNYFIISDNTPLRWAISLGVFKLETGAQNLLAALVKQGVHSARVAPRYSAGKLLAFQFRDLDRDARTRLEELKAGFPAQTLRACK
ncbi:SPOR domain-containing protein [Janthinobacterium sp.]|uniref:SPOR domain-containing protein n=1 Tax=Janthinobacterium sp. TaxID=1871054 RepID=UPI00293D9063|nr:SPOR domain-containing protein [Janthinobacterium sp.]